MTETKPKREIVVEKHYTKHYHARVKDSKYYADGTSPASAVGNLILDHQELFNVKITVESEETSKKKKIGGMFNTYPGSSLPRSN